MLSFLNPILDEAEHVDPSTVFTAEATFVASFKVHSNFRLFATSNITREKSYVLPYSILNRVLRICVSPGNNKIRCIL